MPETRSMLMLTFSTPDGIINLPVTHSCVDAGDDNACATVSVVFQNKTMYFEAETTASALIKLAKALPQGWHIKSCLSCRYGHFCPVGNGDNELFCVTEFEPKQISDLWFVTENDDERALRSRSLFDLCDSYMPQTEDYFTYSDYLNEINR